MIIKNPPKKACEANTKNSSKVAATLITPGFLLAHFENALFEVDLQTLSIVSVQIVSRFSAINLSWKTATSAQQFAFIM